MVLSPLINYTLYQVTSLKIKGVNGYIKLFSTSQTRVSYQLPCIVKKESLTMFNYLFLNRKKPEVEKAILNIAIIPSQFMLGEVGFIIGSDLNMRLGLK